MKKLIYVICFWGFYINAQAQCPTGICSITLPPLPADTTYLTNVPNGVKGVYYAQTLSFRLPKTTSGVPDPDGSIPDGITIDQIEILNVSGNPPFTNGLVWETDNANKIYVPAVKSDGCVKLCGTPNLAGVFDILVTAEATVLGSVKQSITFPVSFEVVNTSATACFSMTGSAGCGSTTTSFTNLIPSNGNPAITYLWTFGNGDNSTAENPTPRTYTNAGTYPIEYTATIDTFPYTLTQIKILAAGCNDSPLPAPFGNPDIYVILKKGSTVVYTSEATPLGDVSLPASVVPTNALRLQTGNYTLEVYDDDAPLGDDLCGTINFTRTTTGVLTSGSLQAELTISHPVEIYTCRDTVEVYHVPPVPTIAFLNLTDAQGNIIGYRLVSSANTGNQWYRNGQKLMNETSPILDTIPVNESAQYSVEVTDINGCKSISQNFPISIHTQAILENRLLVFPNPTNGLLNYQIYLNKAENINIRLFDMMGRNIYAQNIDASKDVYQSSIDMKGMAKGAYYLQISTSEGIAYQKILLE